MAELYGAPKRVGVPPRVVPAALDAEELAPQLSMQVHAEYLEEEAIKLAMPGFTIMFWRRLMATPTGATNLSQWAVLAELALVMVPDSVEAERMFSTMSFLKDKLRNRLTTHLSPCAQLYSQSTYSLSNFPYPDAIKSWREAVKFRGRYRE